MKHLLLLMATILLVIGCMGCGVQEAKGTATPVPERVTGTSEPLKEALSESSEPLPPIPAVQRVQLNRYALSADAKAYLGDAEPDYKALIDSVYAGDSSVLVSEENNAVRVLAVYTESPYSAFAKAEPGDAGIAIAYSEGGSVDQFNAAAKRIVEQAVFEQSNEIETALELYRAVAAGFVLEESSEADLYHVVTERKGGEEAFAAALSYLFVQNNIESYLACGTSDGEERFWVIAKVKDALYHFDPAAESRENNGRGLRFFAMSDEACKEEGYALPCTTGKGEYSRTAGLLCTDTKFESLLSEVTGYEVDVQNHFLYMEYGAEDGFQGSVSTETFEPAMG